ncbi:hypothetical protein FFH21_019665 [Pseudomonas sp. KBS0707]|nr:hypothetical protein DND36_06495 [Pseudomonas savastanoi pv. glycinea]QDW01789.1 hypothetical protein FFH21_019665 [Pseudomonas sp. KBS0707]
MLRLMTDYRADAPRRHAVLDALRPLCGAPRHTRLLRCQADSDNIQARPKASTQSPFQWLRSAQDHPAWSCWRSWQ